MERKGKIGKESKLLYGGYMKFFDDILGHIANGKKSFIFWGFNEDCMTLIALLKESGLQDYCKCIVDHRKNLQGQKIYDFVVQKPEVIKDFDLDVLVVMLDKAKEECLEYFDRIDRRLPEVIYHGTHNFFFSDPDFHRIKKSCITKSYANGYQNSLIHIYQSLKYLCENNYQGDVVEFGVFRAGTIVFISKVLEHFGRKDVKVYGFDIFNETPRNNSVFNLYKHSKVEITDYEAVIDHCKRYGIEIIKGDICDTYKFIEDKDLMFAFFDTDVYTPTKIAIEACYPRMCKGGIFAFDHCVADDRFPDTLGEKIAAKHAFQNKKVFNLNDTGIFIKC